MRTTAPQLHLCRLHNSVQPSVPAQVRPLDHTTIIPDPQVPIQRAITCGHAGGRCGNSRGRPGQLGPSCPGRGSGPSHFFPGESADSPHAHRKHQEEQPRSPAARPAGAGAPAAETQAAEVGAGGRAQRQSGGSGGGSSGGGCSGGHTTLK